MQMLASTAQMKELDRAAIQERGIPSLELMERAARAVARDGAPEEPETVAASVEVETTEVVG